MRLVYYRTDWSRRLENFKRKHPKLYKQIRFRWVDVGRNPNPKKIDYTGIRIAIPPQKIRKLFSKVKSPQPPYRKEWITSIAFEKGKVSHQTIRSYLKRLGYRKFKKVSENVYNAYA